MLTVVPVACLKDNYAYVVYGPGEDALVVDACEAEPVARELERRGLSLRAILATHHHHDHVGGNLELKARTGATIYGHVSERERIPGFDIGVEDGETFEVAGGSFRALHVPGHTLGALTYVSEGIAFTGDTLFCGGCGRLFEGTFAQMFHSLSRLAEELTPETLLYTGHEYTEANLRFAARLFPADLAIAERLTSVEARRRRGEVTASALLREELSTNVFLRAGDPAIADGLGFSLGTEPLEVWTELRRRKNAA